MFGMHRKQNFDIVFGFKSSTAQHFRLSLFALSPSLSFRFPCLILFFFQLAGHLVGFILVGRVFRRILPDSNQRV